MDLQDSKHLDEFKHAQTLFKKNQLAQAQSVLAELVKKEPASVEVHFLLAEVLFFQGKLLAAETFYKNVSLLNKSHINAFYRLGQVARQLNQFKKAIEYFQKALAINPSAFEVNQEYFHVLRMDCAWDDMDQAVKVLEKRAHKEAPFVSMMHCNDPEKLFIIAKNASEKAKEKVAHAKLNFPKRTRDENTKVRLGYVSSDFTDHPTVQLIDPLFELYNKDSFEVYVYSHTKDADNPFLAKMKNQVDKVIDILNIDNEEAAKLIYQDKIDILIDLKGHTAFSRLPIFALRPAPIQIAYLGYPGSTGADFMDYIITDKIVTPKEQLAYYTEKPIYMPCSYQINSKQPISIQVPSRKSCGLPEHAFVFANFNGSYKLTPEMFSVWLSILNKVPKSVLWLYIKSDSTKANLLAFAKSKDISEERLVFAEKVSKEQHLARLKQADLALDTYWINGHTTTSDALLAGVPVITLQGQTFISRVSSSILTALGLTELITETLEDYEQKILKYATSPELYSQLTTTLNMAIESSDFFRPEVYCKHYEDRLKALIDGTLT